MLLNTSGSSYGNQWGLYADYGHFIHSYKTYILAGWCVHEIYFVCKANSFFLIEPTEPIIISIMILLWQGKLEDGRIVAVKKLAIEKSQQGESEFLAEVKMITSIQHKNLVRLVGCCSDGDQRLLVYEYMKNKSLELIIYGMTCINCSHCQ